MPILIALVAGLNVAVAHHATEGNSMSMTLQEAATVAGIAKSTIWRAIKSGRVSTTKTDTGDYRIEPAKLFRAFPATDKNEGMNHQWRWNALRWRHWK
jgi:hypothetical protein